MSTIAVRLHHLLETHRRPNGKRWSVRQVVASLAARGYPGTTRNVIESLLSGTVTDPKTSHLVALGDFFGVPISYFFETQDELAEEEALISRAMQDTHIRQIVVETARLSEGGQANLVKLYPLVLRLIREDHQDQESS